MSKTKEKILVFSCIIFILGLLTVLVIIKPSEQKTIRILEKQTEKDIKYDNKKINVYLFYGDGCKHCEALIKYLNILPKEYDNYFDLYTMEVWYNEENNNLMKQLAIKLDKEIKGVPCLIIGNQMITGFSNDNKDLIKETIKSEFLKDKHFDIYKEYKKEKV